MLCSFLLSTGTGNMIPGSDRISGNRNTAESATKAVPNTRFEASAKLKLSQLSTLQRRHSSLIWRFARLETVERMVVSQWSLLDTCMCALCSVAWQNLHLFPMGFENRNQWCSNWSAWFKNFLAYLFVQICQRFRDNHKRILRIWITCETNHMGMWSLCPIVDGMDCCSPNGSVGSGAMGKLWPIRPYDCTNLSEILKTQNHSPL